MTSVPQAIEAVKQLLAFHDDLRDGDEHRLHGIMAEPSIAVADLRLLLTQYDAAVEALRAFEAANDALCGKRSRGTYLRMIDQDGCRDELLALDEARRDARAILTNQGEKA